MLCFCMSALAAVAAMAVAPAPVQAASGDIELSEDGSAARIPGARVAIDGFTRMNKGTSRAVDTDGSDIGYRYQVAGGDAFVVMVTDAGHAIVSYDREQAQSLDFDPMNNADRESFLRMVTGLDAIVPNGGMPISGYSLEYTFTDQRELRVGAFVYRFCVAAADGRYYAAITAVEDGSPAGAAGPEADVSSGEDAPASGDAASAATAPDAAAGAAAGPSSGAAGAAAGPSSGAAGAADPSKAALFCISGRLVSPDAVSITEAPEGLAAFAAFLSGIDMRPFWVSLRTSGLAMVFIFILGILAARLSLRMGPRLTGVLDSLFTIPMVLPPTVCGFLLLIVFGNSTAFGRWLVAHGIEVVFSWPAAVISAVVVGFPLMYRTVRGAFESQDGNLFDAARTLGWPERRIFFRLMLPLAWPSIAAGTVLSFARAMGEFGATLFVAGNYPGVTQTMPIAIYFQWMGGHSDVATFWVVVVILISFLVILFINFYTTRLQGFRRKDKGVHKEKGGGNGSGAGGGAGSAECEGSGAGAGVSAAAGSGAAKGRSEAASGDAAAYAGRGN